jgi:hypothetical protein
MKLEDLQVKAPKILLYGPPGSGKTALALTVGEAGHVLDLDEGVMTGLTLDDKFKDVRRKVEVNQFFEEDPTKGEAFAKVRAALYKISNLCRSGDYPYRVLVLDSLTALVEYSMRSVLWNSGDVEKRMEIQHYGLAFQQVKNLFAIIKSLPISVIVIAHDMVDENGNILLATSGQKLPYELPRYFDEFWYAKKKPAAGGKTSFTIQTKPTHRLTCRSRFNIPDGASMDTGMQRMYEIMGYSLEVKVNKTEGGVTENKPVTVK